MRSWTSESLCWGASLSIGASLDGLTRGSHDNDVDLPNQDRALPATTAFQPVYE